jgi:hypothetical protein
MTLSELIYSVTTASAPLAASVGNRIYPNILPAGEKQLPAIVHRRVNIQPEQDADGPSKLDHVILDMWVYGHTKKQAEQTAMLLRAALDGYKSETVAYAAFLTEGDDWLAERRAYVVSHEYRITINR